MDQGHRLTDLPPSDDPYWEYADVVKIVQVRPMDCEHRFIHRTSTEVMCEKCRIGYWLSEDMKIRDGHIYYDKTLII